MIISYREADSVSMLEKYFNNNSGLIVEPISKMAAPLSQYIEAETGNHLL